jgi:uncharacterized damage-inducible protein DinB
MLNQTIIPQLQHEAEQTKRMLEKVPYDKAEWKPHAKSMKLGYLATHVAELFSWIAMIINTEELDFSKTPYKQVEVKSTGELLQYLQKNIDESVKALEGATDEHLKGNWTLRNGGHVFFTMPRIAVIRGVGLSHIIHHRGQLSVYLRLLDVPVPGMYGPSADEGFL